MPPVVSVSSRDADSYPPSIHFVVPDGWIRTIFWMSHAASTFDVLCRIVVDTLSHFDPVPFCLKETSTIMNSGGSWGNLELLLRVKQTAIIMLYCDLSKFMYPL